MAKTQMINGRGALVRGSIVALIVAGALGAGGWTFALQSQAAPAQPTKYDRVLNNVFYRVPPGFRAVRQGGAVLMVPGADLSRGEFNGFLVLTEGFALDSRNRALFKGKSRPTIVQALAIASGGLADVPGVKMSVPKLVSNPATDGYEAYLLNSESKDSDAGTDRFAQYAVFITGDRIEVAMRVAYGSAQRFASLATAFDALLHSMEFRNAGAPPPSRLAAPLPSDLTSITPRPAPVARGSAAASNGGQGETGVVCRAEPRTRSYISPVFGGGGPLVSSYIGAARVCRKNGKVVDVR